MESGSSCWRLLLCWICALAAARANVQSKVRCSEQWMEVDIVRSSPRASIYLQQLKNFPDEACKPQLSNGVATFRLSLLEEDILRCGITKVVNKVTGQKVYFHRIIVEEPADTSKHTFTVKCVITEVLVKPEISIASNHTTVRRSVFPAGFQEPEVEIKAEISVSAPMPILGVGVRQGGTLVTGELSVSPGTPLQMEIFLDKDSAPVYGLLVSYMLVTDTKFQEETIILNGCCIDRSVFDNFNTVDGDFLAAKFRAFKFADSNYVQFRGTVNVCLDKCQGIECGNGQVGFGRKRRAIEASNNDKNKIFEVTMSTFIKVDFEEDAVVDKALSDLYIRKGKNRTKARAVVAAEVREQVAPTTIRTEERAFIAQQVNEQFEYQVTKTETSGSSCRTIAIGLAFVLLSLCNLL
ncbi:zona pelucida superfamily protein qsm isoform X2 [Lasioglossum baleicum]|uniref:zona pelucida superfamily protein qsm isoform X2 n=1 Tax=Lasioglossum baleicum TaxID=434251 RepID=UPI003FCE4CB5